MNYLLTFLNTHYAVHGEKVLLAANISVTVMPLPTSLGNLCGICLRVQSDELAPSLAALDQAEIPVEQIFKILVQNGEREYVKWQV